MPLPVSIALAGHRITRFCQNVMPTSRNAQVRTAARICGIESRKLNSTWPMMCSVTKIEARCSRGSRHEGSITGYETPRIRKLRLPAMLGALTRRFYAVQARQPSPVTTRNGESEAL